MNQMKTIKVTNTFPGLTPCVVRGILCLASLALPLAAQSLSRLSLEQSTDLKGWQTVPLTADMIDANGRLISPNDTDEKFYRMQVEVIPIPADLARIPVGSFTMGRTSGDTDFNAPPVTVTVSAFYMGKNEVTKALWDEVRTWAVANGYTDLATGAGKATNHPVQLVSW